MGTVVGASEEIKKHGASDPSLNDYTVSLVTGNSKVSRDTLFDRRQIFSSLTAFWMVWTIWTSESTIVQ